MRYKFGLREPSRGRMESALPLASILTGELPEHPLIEDHLSGIKNFQLYRNDHYSNCGPVSAANQRILLTTHLDEPQVPSITDVLDLYSRSSKPSFTVSKGKGLLWPGTKIENDNGVVMQEMCDELLSGGIAGVRAVAFAKVDPSSLDEMAAAVSIFGSILLGLRMTTAQPRQIRGGVFDYRPDYSPIMNHAVLGGGYDKTNNLLAVGDIVSWGKTMRMTLAFMERQIQEAWVVIWPENLGTKQFRQGVDLDALKAAYFRITDRELALP